MIPDYQSLMLPVLKKASSGEIRISDVVGQLAIEYQLSVDEIADLLPSGKQTTFSNRVHWAKTYLKQAGLVETTRRAYFQITARGKEVLAQNLTRIDVKFLTKFPEFSAFRERKGETEEKSNDSFASTVPVILDEQTPDEVMRSAHKQMSAALGQDILDRILQAPPVFFERLIVALLLAMDYGGSAAEAGRAIGRSGDDGVDGVIDQDTLGLDRVYIQAKRYQKQNSIGSGAIRDFFGSLDMHKASKGLFVTTSSFSSAAIETVEKLGKRIVLIDGQLLTQLMIRYNVGCRVEETLIIKRLDEDFFE